MCTDSLTARDSAPNNPDPDPDPDPDLDPDPDPDPNPNPGKYFVCTVDGLSARDAHGSTVMVVFPMLVTAIEVPIQYLRLGLKSLSVTNRH